MTTPGYLRTSPRQSGVRRGHLLTREYNERGVIFWLRHKDGADGNIKSVEDPQIWVGRTSARNPACFLTLSRGIAPVRWLRPLDNNHEENAH